MICFFCLNLVIEKIKVSPELIQIQQIFEQNGLLVEGSRADWGFRSSSELEPRTRLAQRPEGQHQQKDREQGHWVLVHKVC